jgi:DMSO/TMAO reductase YedYZ molybdopterin-dependent catalytic subunit
VAAVLDAAGVRSSASRVEIRSVTGWGASLPLADADRSLLAWSVAGELLPTANGAPLRLVAPDHRGLEWVKWVATIHVE